MLEHPTSQKKRPQVRRFSFQKCSLIVATFYSSASNSWPSCPSWYLQDRKRLTLPKPFLITSCITQSAKRIHSQYNPSCAALKVDHTRIAQVSIRSIDQSKLRWFLMLARDSNKLTHRRIFPLWELIDCNPVSSAV